MQRTWFITLGDCGTERSNETCLEVLLENEKKKTYAKSVGRDCANHTKKLISACGYPLCKQHSLTTTRCTALT